MVLSVPFRVPSILDIVITALQDLTNCLPSELWKNGLAKDFNGYWNDCRSLLVTQCALKFKEHYLFRVRPFTLYQVWAKMIEPSFTYLLGVSVIHLRCNWCPSYLPFSFDIIIVKNSQELCIFLWHKFGWKQFGSSWLQLKSQYKGGRSTRSTYQFIPTVLLDISEKWLWVACLLGGPSLTVDCSNCHPVWGRCTKFENWSRQVEVDFQGKGWNKTKLHRR